MVFIFSNVGSGHVIENEVEYVFGETKEDNRDWNVLIRWSFPVAQKQPFGEWVVSLNLGCELEEFLHGLLAFERFG